MALSPTTPLSIPHAAPSTTWWRRWKRNVAGWFVLPTRRSKCAALVAVIAGLLATTWMVYAAGGVKYPAVHAMYIPIIGAALMFAWWGGLLTAVVAALLLGPRMPLETRTGEAQEVVNWLERMAFFSLVGLLVGLGVTMLRRRMLLLIWLRDHDASTGLLNQSGFVKGLDEQLAACAGGRSIVVVQLNNLTEIQNTFGPDFTDALLLRVCERARELVPTDLALALLQRDRLGVVLPTEPDLDHVPAPIDERVRAPYEVEGTSVYIDFALGTANYPEHGLRADQLVQKASIAMHHAVQRGLPSLTYDSATDRTNRDNLVILGMLPAAIAAGELTLWHQAKVDLASGAVIGTEALLRWDHPTRGLIPPGQFVPQVENSPLINDLSRWVVRRALSDAAAWGARGHRIGVSVNLSVRNLHDRALFAVLDECVAAHGFDPADIELEITESSVMHDVDDCAELIAGLRDRGFAVSIDDFGTGYSSLAHLQGLPVTTLKIDQRFVRDLVVSDTDQVIVRSIVELAGSLGLRTVAEGVADLEAAALLRSWGCDAAQGFAFHRPCPYDEFVGWLEHRPLATGTPLTGAT